VRRVGVWSGCALVAEAQRVYTTPEFNSITMCYASQEKLRNGVDGEGLGWSDMRSDIRKLLKI